MENVIDMIIAYAPYIAMIVGFLVIGLTMFKKPIMWLVEMTKTKRDDKVASYVYAFIEKYAVSSKKLMDFAKEYKKKK